MIPPAQRTTLFVAACATSAIAFVLFLGMAASFRRIQASRRKSQQTAHLGPLVSGS